MFAHSGSAGAGRWHPLEEHLRGTASLARRFGDPFGGGELAYWLGLLHDVGKASCAWQGRLRAVAGEGRPVGVEHKLAGVLLARERGLAKFALAIHGHHGGMESPAELADRLEGMSPEDVARAREAHEVVAALLPELAALPRVDYPHAWRRDPLVAEMGLRLAFSALVDADYLDTAAHFADEESPRVRPDADFAVLRDRYESVRQVLLAGRSQRGRIDDVREEVYRACVEAAELPQGVFRLAAPTGVGKTISSGAFAVHHAAARGLRRVIVAVPFLTITEQNAGVYRDLLDVPEDPVVLEHHSGVDFDRPGNVRARLAAENWDAPFVVTTNVRLFESLFDRRPAAMRRLHRLAGSVIVLDEVQALPHRLLVPILDALRTLVEHFGVTVLLSSATQPDFWNLSPFNDLSAADIVADPVGLAKRVRRARFEWRIAPSPDLAECAREAATAGRALVVVNTTTSAKTVYDAWRPVAEEGTAWHLSTRMCPAHRRRVLAKVRGRLARGEPALLVATQLIEAGVDVDFPLVYRALAPADSLLQAGGRANREGNLVEGGGVVIFDPDDGGAPPAYRTLIGNTRVAFAVDSPTPYAPDDLDALRTYYHLVYDTLGLKQPRHLGQLIQQARRRFDFHTVTDGPLLDPQSRKRDRSRAFRMIEDEGITLITPGGAADDAEREHIAELADRVRTAPHPEAAWLRRLQPYMTTLHPSALRRPGVAALMTPVLGEVGAPGALAEWIGGYDPDTGIDLDPRTEEFVC